MTADEAPDFFEAFGRTSLEEADWSFALRVHPAGEVALASGEIVACDPLVNDGTAFARRVLPGAYPVDLLLAERRGDTRVALARMTFGEGQPSRWEMATCEEQDVRALGAGEIFGYGVDAGTGCFADPRAIDALDRRELSDALERDLKPTWCAAAWAGGVAFSTGFGDGTYASWWGLDGERVVCLVTDFGIGDLARPVHEEDPVFRRAHAREVAAKLLEETAILARGDDRTARELAYGAAWELAMVADAAIDLAPTLFAALERTTSVEVAGPLCIALRKLATKPAAQPTFAAWLRRARRDWACALVEGLHGMVEIQPELVAELIGLYNDARESTRAALVRFVRDDSLSAIAEVALDETSGTLRAAAVEALGRMERVTPSTAARLARMTQDPSTEVRMRLARPLVRSGAVDAARALLDDPSPHVRFRAAREIYRNEPDRFDDHCEHIALLVEADEGLRVEAADHVHDRTRRAGLLERLAAAGLDDAREALRRRA